MSHPEIKPVKVERPNETTVLVTRTFDAPKENVYKAYTTPNLVQQWMLGPPGWTMPVCEMDLKVGGEFNWRWSDEAQKNEFGFTGKFLEIAPDYKIVHTETYHPGNMKDAMGDSLVSVVFVEKDKDTSTDMQMTIKYESKEVCDQALATGMTDGMEMSYQNLDRVLKKT